MEEIRSSLDIIVDKFNDSVTHSAPKKLSFERLSDSLDDSNAGLPKKRRLIDSPRISLNGSLNISGSKLNSSANTSTDGSPWQARSLRADLVEAKGLIARLKQQIERENRVRRETEALYDNKVSALKHQCDFSTNKIKELERHMDELRTREQMAYREVLAITAKLNKFKCSTEEQMQQLQIEKTDIQEKASCMKSSLTMELTEARRVISRLQTELEIHRDQLDTNRKLVNDFKERCAGYEELKLADIQQKQDLEQAKSRIRELEYQISNYNDWKEITENAQQRLQSIPDLEKQVERLRSSNKHLHELIGNKLLLEEQLHDYKMRYEKAANASAEAAALQVKVTHLDQELKEWIKVAQDHCLANTIVSPMALRSRIEQLLKQDIVLADESNTKQLAVKSMQTSLQDLQQKCDIYMKNNEELNIILKRHKTFKDRLQRKLLMVSRERDFYKQLVDNYDKDMTMSNTVSDMHGDTQLRYRIDVLERTLTGYKEMYAALEKELNVIRQQEAMLEPSNENFDEYKKEIDNLRLENDKLMRRVEELELEFEHRCLKGDFNVDKFKVVHLSKNPASEAYENTKNLMEKYQAEIERLKRRIKQLEEENELTTQQYQQQQEQHQQERMNETTNMTMNIKEMNQLRAQLETTNAKISRMKEYYRSASLEFRDVCYMLLGYRIDRIDRVGNNNSNYKLSSMYAESPDDYLSFRLNSSNLLELLETPYSAQIQPLIDRELVNKKSFPAFLSNLTLELFQRATVTIN